MRGKRHPKRDRPEGRRESEGNKLARITKFSQGPWSPFRFEVLEPRGSGDPGPRGRQQSWEQSLTFVRPRPASLLTQLPRQPATPRPTRPRTQTKDRTCRAVPEPGLLSLPGARGLTTGSSSVQTPRFCRAPGWALRWALGTKERAVPGASPKAAGNGRASPGHTQWQDRVTGAAGTEAAAAGLQDHLCPRTRS